MFHKKAKNIHVFFKIFNDKWKFNIKVFLHNFYVFTHFQTLLPLFNIFIETLYNNKFIFNKNKFSYNKLNKYETSRENKLVLALVAQLV